MKQNSRSAGLQAGDAREMEMTGYGDGEPWSDATSNSNERLPAGPS